MVVGADRVAANGDVANKIGTFQLAVAARHLGVPFYVAAPSSTCDPSLASGRLIPIEERPGTELTQLGGVLLAEPGGCRAGAGVWGSWVGGSECLIWVWGPGWAGQSVPDPIKGWCVGLGVPWEAGGALGGWGCSMGQGVPCGVQTPHLGLRSCVGWSISI